MIPSSRQLLSWLGVIGLTVVLCIVASLWHLGFWVWAPIFVFVTVLIVDGMSLLTAGFTERMNSAEPALQITRTVAHALAVGREETVTFNVSNQTKKSLKLSLFDEFPHTFVNTTGMPVEETLHAGEFFQTDYRVLPTMRGQFSFTGTQIRIHSALSLWELQLRHNNVSETKVYPDFSRRRKEDLTADVMHSEGLKRHRKRGTGTDFAHLREYREGDQIRQIDHKATARIGELISREYQIERDRQVIIALDCSRRMRVFQADLTHFDHSLNAAVHLSQTILNSGDAVGLMTFGTELVDGQSDKFIKAKKGKHQVNALVNQLFDLDTSRLPPDYVSMAQKLMTLQKRQSLIVILTTLHEEDREHVQAMLNQLLRRHIVVLASLKEALLAEPLNINDNDDAIYYAARENYMKQRVDMNTTLKHHRAIFIDTYPNKLTANLINVYLNIKQSGMF